MKKYIVDNPVFSDSIDIVEVTDPAHANRINQAPKQIFENTLALKRQVDGNRILIDLSGSEYDQNIYYPVTGTPIPKGGLHKIHAYTTFDMGAHPTWATNTAGYTCNMEIYDKAQTWGQADGATICTDYSWKHTGQSPCGYLQMTHSSIPVVILRGGGVYYIETDYAEGWTVRTGVYTCDGDTVRPGTKRTLKFNRATIFANINGDVTGKVNGYTLGKNVPSDAQLTDTVYTHPTTAGYKHIPSGGSDGQVLRWSANGTAVWGAETIGSIEDIIFFGEEQNPEGVENKEVFIPNFTLTDGVKVTIRFGTGCLVDNATLNVSGTGAYPIMLDAVTPLPNGFIDYYGDIAELVYYGGKWFLVGCSLWRKVKKLEEEKAEMQTMIDTLIEVAGNVAEEQAPTVYADSLWKETDESGSVMDVQSGNTGCECVFFGAEANKKYKIRTYLAGNVILPEFVAYTGHMLKTGGFNECQGIKTLIKEGKNEFILSVPESTYLLINSYDTTKGNIKVYALN